MTLSLKNHVAVVTGASRGIGRAIAVELAQQGCDLALLGRDQNSLNETIALCSEYGNKNLALIADVRDRQSLHIAFDAITTHFGNINFLINNHGMARINKLLEDPEDNWETIIDINLKASIYFTKLILPTILKAPQNTKRALIYIASIAAKIDYPGGSGYATSKHGLLSFANCLFEEIREEGIKVCSICPGYVNTELVKGRGLTENKMIQPQDIADTVSYLLHAPATCCPTEIIIRPQFSPYSNQSTTALKAAC
jgi:3-oxoacyl-[acyl-carrier protein] reductase